MQPSIGTGCSDRHVQKVKLSWTADLQSKLGRRGKLGWWRRRVQTRQPEMECNRKAACLVLRRRPPSLSDARMWKGQREEKGRRATRRQQPQGEGNREQRVEWIDSRRQPD